MSRRTCLLIVLLLLAAPRGGRADEDRPLPITVRVDASDLRPPQIVARQQIAVAQIETALMHDRVRPGGTVGGPTGKVAERSPPGGTFCGSAAAIVARDALWCSPPRRGRIEGARGWALRGGAVAEGMRTARWHPER